MAMFFPGEISRHGLKRYEVLKMGRKKKTNSPQVVGESAGVVVRKEKKTADGNVLQIGRVDKKYIEKFSTSDMMRLAENTIMATVRSEQLREVRTWLRESDDEDYKQYREVMTKAMITTDEEERQKLREEANKIMERLREKYPKHFNTEDYLRTEIRVFNNDSKTLIKKNAMDLILSELDTFESELKPIEKSSTE